MAAIKNSSGHRYYPGRKRMGTDHRDGIVTTVAPPCRRIVSTLPHELIIGMFGSILSPL